MSMSIQRDEPRDAYECNMVTLFKEVCQVTLVGDASQGAHWGEGGCSSRPKGTYGTTDEAFVLILLVCLSQPDSNSNRLHTGG